MPNLRKWSQSASGNATVTGGTNTINWAEGQPASSVNNSAREEMAQVRRVYRPDEWGWVEFSATASVASQTTFKITGNQTADYTAARRVRLTGGSVTMYGTIVSSSFTAETTVTLTKDSGSLSASMSIAAVSAAYDKNQTSASVSVPVAATTTELLTGTDSSKYATADAVAALWELGTSVSATATVSLGEGGYFYITGSPSDGISDIDFAVPKDGREAICVFTGSATLTHNATTLILPGGANIVTASGDVARFVQDSTDNVRCVSYQRASGAAVKGVVQEVSTQTGAVATGTTQIPDDDTIPQITEGDQYMTLAITPKSTTNKLKIEVRVFGTSTAVVALTAALFQDATANALAAGSVISDSGSRMVGIAFTHYMNAGTTSATTFRVRAGGDAAGTTTFNGVSSGTRRFGGVCASSITITEYAP